MFRPCVWLATMIVLVFPLFVVAGQEMPIALTLEDALDIALRDSYEAKTLALQLLEAEKNVSAARGRFKTNAAIDLQAPNFTEQVQAINVPNEPTSYNTTGSIQWRGGLNIEQPLPTNGSLSLQSSLRQRRDSVFLDNLDATNDTKRFFTNVRLTLVQPLFVPNTLKLGLERANLQLELAERSYTRTELDIIFDVTDRFYAMYRATREFEIARDELDQQQQSFDLARQKYAAGLIPEVEALQMEVDLAQSQNGVLGAEGNLSRESDRFKLSVGLPMTQVVAVETDFAFSEFEVDPQKALEHGLNHRSEVRETQINRRLAEITVKQTDALRKIRVDLRGFYELSGVSDAGLGVGAGAESLFRSSLTDLERRPKNRGVFVNVTVPLWDSGVNRSQVEAAEAVVQQSELNMVQNRRLVERDIRNAITRFEEARGRIDVLRQSEDVAVRSYEITLARFDNGDITSQELALDRDRLTEARTAYLNAYIQYQLAVADLKRQTLYDFESGQSLIPLD